MNFNLYKKIVLKYIPLKVVDKFFYYQLLLIGPFIKLYTKYTGASLPKSRELLKKIGVYPILDHYYQPLFNDARLKKSLREPRNLPGIDLNHKQQLSLMKELIYAKEVKDLNLTKIPESIYDFDIRGAFKFGDAEFLYQMIRLLKPKKFVEIGSGSSTRIAYQALKKNKEDTNFKCEHICIEPYEMPWLEDIGVTVIRQLAEDCDSSIFSNLEENDILFIDSSHIIRPQGDVLKEYLEIVPTLKKGVYVHVHDIFTPRDYLDEWIRDEVHFWNEQYLVEALLSNSDKYEIVATLNHLYHNNFNDLKKVCPYISEGLEPGSLYFKIKS